MEAFEYTVVYIKGDPREAGTLRGANDLGTEGWEAYGVTEDSTGWWLFLKRATGEVVATPGRRRNR
jgi:hypothetical protein